MEHAGSGRAARDRGVAGRDRDRSRLPAAAAGSAVPALHQRDGRHPEPLLRSVGAAAAAALVSRVRLERGGAAGAARARPTAPACAPAGVPPPPPPPPPAALPPPPPPPAPPRAARRR